MPGTSPLARGKRGPKPGARQAAGNIPARAGKTTSPGNPVAGLWEHPRSRGENSGYAPNGLDPFGTSPLARGKRQGLHPCPRRTGNIPARAGKTLNNQQISVPSEEFYITQLDEHVEHDAAWLDLTTPVVIRHHL